MTGHALRAHRTNGAGIPFGPGGAGWSSNPLGALRTDRTCGTNRTNPAQGDLKLGLVTGLIGFFAVEGKIKKAGRGACFDFNSFVTRVPLSHALTHWVTSMLMKLLWNRRAGPVI